MKKLFFMLFLLFFSIVEMYAAQIFGKITDNNKQALAFVTVYVEQVGNKNFNKGTVSNISGEFALQLPDGNYTVSFRYMGYKAVTKSIEMKGKDLPMYIELLPELLTLNEVEIVLNREDPAYEIIRNAQSKRKFYLEQAQIYQANAYIKGLQRIDEAPKKAMGRDITLPGAEGDSVNRAIVYLSESISELYVNQKDKKEIVISSKVSGRSNSFSWNSALDLELNMYENSIEMGGLSPRPFISPIASSAMLHYKYEYLGTVEEKGLFLHKIKLIPKQKGSPVYGGVIYIQDQNWRIHSTELKVTKNDTGIDFVDSLTLRQTHIPITEDVWKIGTQSVNFKWSLDFLGLKFKGSGYFVGVFSDYKINEKMDKKLFSAEKLKVLEESNKKDTAYWNKVRPFALTNEEAKDYVRKDSIYKVRDSKVYKDSIDKKNNKFKAINLLLGYTYRNSFENYNFGFSSPINTIQTNTVEGIVINPKITFYRNNREKQTAFAWENDLRYGFGSQRLYAQTNIYRRFNATNRFFIRLQGGSFVAQINNENPISSFVNSIYTSFVGQNYMKLYEKNYVKFTTGAEIINGITLNVSAEYANRIALANTSEYKSYTVDWFTKNHFTSNNPIYYSPDILIQPAEKFFPNHQAVFLQAETVIKFGQKYITRPRQKVNTESKYPTLKLAYQAGLGNVDFHYVQATLTDEIATGQLGKGEYYVSAGSFVQKNKLYFMDYAHFLTTQTIFANNKLNSFYLLPYYRFSTANNFIEAHYEHHFNGFLTNRIGFMRKLGWTLVAGGHYLTTSKSNKDIFTDQAIGNYGEITIGLERIFKIIRIDMAFGIGDNVVNPIGFRLRTDLF
jgi:hypothetical protein